ncbi:hypothetical protein ANO11243_003580 [Dothideomycetidae sp. 11243]|nr:hypothetical protein ANO11243_003580 [fungal sp. No.11243]
MSSQNKEAPIVEYVGAEKSTGLHGQPDVQNGYSRDISEAELAEIKAVKQGLHQRHISMIALAGTIGTGLFLGYTFIGLAVSPMVLSVAEMGALVPLSGGVVRYIEYFVDPALSFANGWNLMYSYFIGIPAEIVAAAVLVEFWVYVNNAIWITVFGALMVLTAVLFVRVYGELEFFFSWLKILLIIGINIMALVITCGGGPDHKSIGFRYWHNPGAFVQYLQVPGALGRFMGFWTTLNNALYAYSGIETITVAAAETRNARAAIPHAAKRVFWRIVIFYVLTIFMVGLIVPSNDPHLLAKTGTASQSPFVIAATRAGIKVVPSIINSVVLTSAWSAGNSSLLGGSRVLFGMAQHGHAPRLFLRINRFGVPYLAVALISVFMSLGYMTLSHSASTVFGWLQDLVAVSSLVNWIVICITYLRFYYACRVQNIDRHAELPWAAPFQPYITWASLGLFSVLLLTGGYSTFIKHHWSTETSIASYFNIPFILVLYFGYKIWKKTSIIPLRELPIRGFIRIYQSEPVPEVKVKRGLQKLNFLWG